MKILTIGGDKRMVYAAGFLGAGTIFAGKTDKAVSGKFGAVVLPLPLTRDGENIFAPLFGEKLPFEIIAEYAKKGARVFAGGNSEKLAEVCRGSGLLLEDYFADEPLTLRNAALTAEAAAVIMAQSTDGSLLGARALITGHGRIARLLARRLESFGCETTIAARNPASRAEAELNGFGAVTFAKAGELCGEFDFIANTVPEHILSEEFFGKLKRGCVFTELATIDGEREKELCEKSGVKYIPAGGLPGKFSPKTAGKFIAAAIAERLGAP